MPALTFSKSLVLTNSLHSLFQENCSVLVYSTASEPESTRCSITPPPPPASEPDLSGLTEEEELAKNSLEAEKVELGESLQTDRSKGTVRRATRQLEQKIKQDVSSSPLLSSALSCPSQRSVVSTSSRDRSENTSDLFLDLSTVPAHHHQPENRAEVKVEKEEPSPVEEGMGKGCKIRLREEECGHTGFLEMDTSVSDLKQSHSTPSRSSSEAVFKLEGVTEEETSTDCLSQDHLREMWETLRQLGAFLCQLSSGSDRRLSHPWAGKEHKRGWVVQERAKEVEARMRQAGLTPPSLIKRSASLAKLGSLDLSANDLSELELSPAPPSPCTAKPRPHSLNDDTSKKKRVLPRRTPSLPPSCTSRLPPTRSHSDKRLKNCQTGEVQHKVPMPPPVSPSSNEYCRQGKVPDPANTPVPEAALISVATRQQYGRTHPLRRLKKRTSNYHTM